jgi:hypothetical protein
MGRVVPKLKQEMSSARISGFLERYGTGGKKLYYTCNWKWEG